MMFVFTGNKTSRFKCPADFVTFCPQPCSSTLTGNLKKKDKEFWLIKAPVNFDPKWWVPSLLLFVSLVC